MTPIHVTADAAFDIARQLATGELKISGIQLRDASGTIRYILRGFENLPSDPTQASNLPSLGALSGVLDAAQVLQIVSIAQAAAVAATLRRIEQRLIDIERRLAGIEDKLTRLQTTASLLLAGMRSSPVNRLKAARTAAMIAFHRGDGTALIAAAQSAEHAARDILDQAWHLVRVEEDGLPVALAIPGEHADLVASAADAMVVTSAMLLALEQPDAAARLMYEAAGGIEAMRRRLAACLSDPELLLRRARIGLASDGQLLEAGRAQREALLRCRGRAVMIEAGLIGHDLARVEFERATPHEGLAFLPVAPPSPNRLGSSRTSADRRP